MRRGSRSQHGGEENNEAEALSVQPHQKTQGWSIPRNHLCYQNYYLFDRFQLSSCPNYVSMTLLALPGMKEVSWLLRRAEEEKRKKKKTKALWKIKSIGQTKWLCPLHFLYQSITRKKLVKNQTRMRRAGLGVMENHPKPKTMKSCETHLSPGRRRAARSSPGAASATG